MQVNGGTSAIVRSGPMTSNSLEIQDIVDFGSGSVRFQFLGDAEITSGLVRITCDLWFIDEESFSFGVREEGGSSKSFVTIRFTSSGFVNFVDADTSGLNVIGDYEAGRALPLVLEFDLDAGTYDLVLDGEMLLDDEPHGVTGRGIGAVYLGPNSDATLDGTLHLDNLRVEVPPVFADGFESGDASMWSSQTP